jgi:hypothetical protein
VNEIENVEIELSIFEKHAKIVAMMFEIVLLFVEMENKKKLKHVKIVLKI